MAKRAHPQTIEAVRRLRRDGWSYYRLASLCGYSRVAVRAWCDERAKEQIRASSKRISKEEKARRWQKWEGRKHRSEYYADQNALKRDRVRDCSPPWLNDSHKDEIKAMYKEARRLTRETGVRHEVDHVHPIQGENLCGLHVPWNLGIKTKEQNQRKGRSLW